MNSDQFWRKSYDPGMADVDPSDYEISIIDACREAFARFPKKTALAYMGTHISFAELDRYSGQFANMLISNGFSKGDVVGINLPNIPEYVIAWLGTLKAGCVVSGVSPLLPPEDMAYQLRDSHARGLVTLDAIFAARLTRITPDIPELALVVVASVGGFMPAVKRVLGKLLKKIPTGQVTPLEGKTIIRIGDILKRGAFPADPPRVVLTPDDTAYIQYTGGTTGLPKGAVINHRSAVADMLVVQRWLGWEKGGGLALSGFPFFHIAGLFFNANCVSLGLTQVLVPNPRDTNHICKEIARYRPTVLVNVPSLYLMLMENPKFSLLDHS
ncbi:MAG: AMP-binding protein, partial [Myxococcota bacterium]